MEGIFTVRSVIPAEDRPGLEIDNIEGENTDIVLRGVAGTREEPHVLYFPAEYDGVLDKEYLASGILEKGGGLFWADFEKKVLELGLHCLNEVSKEAMSVFARARDRYAIIGPTVVMGRGLGTIPAILTACEHEDTVLCLILESAFPDTASYLRAMGLEGEEAVSGDPFDLKKKISRFKKAILFMHSHRDSMVPVSSVEWLVAESRSKATQFQIVPSEDRWDLAYRGGALYFDTIWQFIGLRMGRRPKRRPRSARRPGP